MKTIIRTLILTVPLWFGSCGVSSALVLNQNHNTTQVQLSGNNFNIVDKVSGTAEVEYILMIGGLDKRQLYENAYSDMVNKAKLTGSKALINIITEEHVGGVPPFYYKRTVTVSANVIEFTR